MLGSAMLEPHRGDGGGDWDALPSIAPKEDVVAARQLEGEGEVFELRPDQSGGTHCTWLSGPAPGYGFSVSPTSDDVEQHERNIRDFLSMIDPKTGYIGDD